MTVPAELPYHEMSSYLSTLSDAVYWPLPLVLWPAPLGIPFWIVLLWTRASERKVRLREQTLNRPATELDRGSWPLINYGWRVVRLSAFILAFVTPPWASGTARYELYCSGLILMVCGTLLRRHCFKMLGEQFTYTVRVSEKSEIITRGLYKYVRHPSYTGGMLYNFGIGLALTNWKSTILIGVGMLVMYFYRVRVEERALLKVHEINYSEYMRHTKRFLPFIV